jgi:hypothetical protein
MMVRLRSWHRERVLTAALLLAGAAAVSGCSSYALIDSVPASVGGLPEGAPERPAAAPAYPAVHDMPRARSDAPLSEAERKRLRDDLVATRERAARRATATESTGSTPPSGSTPNP